MYSSVSILSTVIVYVPALVISYSPVTFSVFTLMVKAPSVSFTTLIVTLSPTFASAIGETVSIASFLVASNTLVTVSPAYSSFSPAITVIL